MTSRLYLYSFFVLFISLLISCSKKPFNPPGDLTVEMRENPLGIDTEIPRFSWKLSDTAIGARQSAYQILVASSEKLLKDRKADIWNSGKVESDRSVFVEYEGTPLESATKYYWKVRLWNQYSKETSWSQPAWFETAYLNDDDWKAAWIAMEPREDSILETITPRSVMMRKDFEVEGEIERARVYATGLGNYYLMLNGQRVGKDLLTPGWTDYPTRVQYQVYDITDMLHQGSNAIGAVLGNMWYSSGLGWKGGSAYSRGPLLFNAQISLWYSDGTFMQLFTAPDWKAHESPIIENTLYHGESYDARLEQEGWDQPGFDDSSWHHVNGVDPPTEKLVAQQGPPIRKTQELVPDSIYQTEQGSWVFDLGQNMVGWARLKVQEKAGTRVEMKFAELLHEDGTAAQENLRSAEATDLYICKGDSLEIWEPSFTYHGFRYVEVSGLTRSPTEELLTGIVIHSAAPFTGEFYSSDEILNGFWQNTFWGQRGNMHSVPTDCPQRDERLGWMGDAQVFAPTSCYNMDMALFYEKWLRDMTDCQHESGYVYDVNPAIVVSGPAKPGWGDAVAVVPWVVYRWYGDKRILEENYEGIRAWVEYMRGESEDYIYTWGDDDWGGYGDWIAVVESPRDPIASAYYYYSTKLLSKMAGVLGKTEDQQEYGDLSEKIRKAFNYEYFDAISRQYEGNTQTANLLPLVFGITPEEDRDSVAANIAGDVIERGHHPSTGFLGTPYLLPVMSDFGYHRDAYKTAVQTEYPSWGYMLKQGATTVWELWNSDKEPPEQMNSRNHFCLGSVVEWYYSHLAGIRPDPEQPGFKHSIIHPMPARGLDRAGAKFRTHYGLLSSDWKQNGDRFKLHVKVPANTHATVILPVKDDTSIWMNFARIYPESDCSASWFKEPRVENDRIFIEIPAGTFDFELR